MCAVFDTYDLVVRGEMVDPVEGVLEDVVGVVEEARLDLGLSFCRLEGVVVI